MKYTLARSPIRMSPNPLRKTRRQDSRHAFRLRFVDFVGCEIDEDYFKAQEERFAAHTAQQSLFVDSKAVSK